MRVCVTGGTGFLGTALVRDLLARGVSVRVLARPSCRADRLETQGAEVVRGGLGDPDCIARAVEGADIVYHLAAKVATPGSRADFLETNVDGTERVLTGCLRQGVGRVVYASSLAVYGPVANGQRIEESTPCDASPQLRDFYAQSKILADELAVTFARETALPITILRPGIVYGPGKQLPVGLLGFTLGKTNFVFGNPKHRIPLNYVENLVDALQVAAHSGGGQLRQFNIVDDDELTLAKYHEAKTAVDKTVTHFSPGWPVRLAGPFAEIAVRMLPLGGSVRFSKHQLNRALQDRWYDTHRIRQETGWAPKVGLKDALYRTWKAGR
ncbi:MAG: NAD-dependent epimerase/dehydratase family protein [Candidatus Korobacteraceae bacterium]|jgi:nucleoside-diphosphate-sugar epimerase